MSRVLVAEDDATQLDLRAKLLETGGHQVSVACCPEETLRLLPSADVVIMDLRFRNARGEPDAAEDLSLIRHIREAGCAAPVIVLSGWPADLEGHPEERLVSRIMVRPVGLAALLAAVAASLT